MVVNLAALETSGRLLEDVESLLENHPAAKQTKPGRPAAGVGVDPLLRSCVALCYAAWEVYVEEALRGAVEYLLDNLDAGDLPTALRNWVASENKKCDPWNFAGEGWKEETRKNLRVRLYGEDGQNGFNSANAKAVSRLYRDVLGYEPLSEVRWQRASNKWVVDGIDALVYERGAIVHTGTTSDDPKFKGKLDITKVRSRLLFIGRLRNEFDRRLVDHLESLTV